MHTRETIFVDTVMTAADVALAEEAELVRLAQVDRAAFGALYDRYVDALYRFAWQRTGEHGAAQDVVAETFRRALEGLPRYRWQGRPFGAWLVRIAVNVLRERRRHDAADLPAPLPDDADPPDDAPAALDGIIEQEERSELWRLVGTLSLDHQRVLTWRYAHNLDYDTIARTLGKTPAAAKQLAYRALNALRVAARASGMWAEREQHHDHE